MMADDKVVQEKYIEFKVLDQQIKQMQQQLQSLEQQSVEITNVAKGLDDLKSAKQDTEILVPLSQGVFVKAKLMENSKVLVSVGANVVVVKSMEDAKSLVEKQSAEIAKIQQQIMEQMQGMIMQASSLQQELQKLMSAKNV